MSSAIEVTNMRTGEKERYDARYFRVEFEIDNQQFLIAVGMNRLVVTSNERIIVSPSSSTTILVGGDNRVSAGFGEIFNESRHD